MGLFNRRSVALPTPMRDVAHWHVAALLVVLCVLIALFGEEGQEQLRYDRLAIIDGDYWRLISGHFAHLGWPHLLLNSAGVILVWLLVGRKYSRLEWCIVLLFSIAATSGGFWFFDESLAWYVGFSGVLHGLLIAGALQGLKTETVECVAIVILVGAKLAWEQVAGPLPGSESVSGGNVVVNAHLYGAIGGAIAAGLLWRRAAAVGSI